MLIISYIAYSYVSLWCASAIQKAIQEVAGYQANKGYFTNNLVSMKTRLFLLVLSVLGTTHALAQGPGNALSFDGSNDYVSTSLPAVFTNVAANDLTIETWIKPQGNAFARVLFAQFSTTSFATLSLSPTNQIYFYVNNLSGALNQTSAALPLNQWSHVACTWSAATQQIEIYIDGTSVPLVSGGSSSTGNSNLMTIGSRTNAAQYFTGELDELRIWDEVRTPCEIAVGIHTTFTTATPNLVAAYDFNQGAGGAANPGLTTLPDLNTTYDGTLLNFGLAGSSSNWVSSGASISTSNQNTGTITGIDSVETCDSFTWINGTTYTSSIDTATFLIAGGAANGCDSVVTLDLTILPPAQATDIISACDSFTWINGTTYSSSTDTATFLITGGAANGCDSIVTLDLTLFNSAVGLDLISACDSFTWIDGTTYSSSTDTATFLITGGAANGCDSMVMLDLTINTVDSSVTASTDGLTLTSGAVGTYQWLNCDNDFAPVAGATEQAFTPATGGNYAVAVTANGCTDTSACVTVTLVGIADRGFQGLAVYPNPTRGRVTLDLGASSSSLTVKVIASHGQVVSIQTFAQSSKVEVEMPVAAGLYLLALSDGTGQRGQVKVVKE
jgi:hypothetical protein